MEKIYFQDFSSDGGSIVFIKYLGAQSALGVIRVNANKTFYFPLRVGKFNQLIGKNFNFRLKLIKN